MENQKGGFFNGLKKMIFKDEGVSMPETPGPASAPVIETKPVAEFIQPNNTPIVTEGAKEDAAKKAYQLIESINQPGVDFFEVWNAVEENGGIQSSTLKQSFNTLKFADKTLTKEKFLKSGNYYCSELQKALQSDIQKKQLEKEAIENKIKLSNENLTKDIVRIEEQIKTLQKDLTDKQAELANLKTHWQPRLHDIDQKIQNGQHAIEGVIYKMKSLIALAEKEL